MTSTMTSKMTNTGASHVTQIVAALDAAETRNAGLSLSHSRITFLDEAVVVLKKRNRGITRSKLAGVLVDQFKNQWDSMSQADREKLHLEI